MIDFSTRPTRIARRTLAVIVCYLLFAQAFFAALATTLANARMNAPDGAALAIVCHGADPSVQDAPAGQDKDDPVEFPCAHCAIATANGLLLPTSVPAVAAPQNGAAIAVLPNAVAACAAPRARAGLARAPPTDA